MDLRDGRCVRLYQGDYAQETVYDEDPVGVARAFSDAGAPWIHVVDLDAARTGAATNLAVIEAICSAVPSRVQSGGGVRSAEAAAALLDAGVHRVVVGTAAIEHPELVDTLGTKHPGRVAVGLDARGMEVAVRGWVEGSGADLVATAGAFDSAVVGALVVTSIAVDGTLAGPDIAQLTAVLAATSVPVIASGGVGTLDDLRALRKLRVGDRTLGGVIAGKAIYEGRFTVPEALTAIK
ncbi:MAG: 1-(5-phosphoribosyl)-5-[(5-phosphoribosylamino)methylideneamino]imidazole-4-carboxamide isomerase [Acidimicrobiia bacterium]